MRQAAQRPMLFPTSHEPNRSKLGIQTHITIQPGSSSGTHAFRYDYHISPNIHLSSRLLYELIRPYVIYSGSFLLTGDVRLYYSPSSILKAVALYGADKFPELWVCAGTYSPLVSMARTFEDSIIAAFWSLALYCYLPEGPRPRSFHTRSPYQC